MKEHIKQAIKIINPILKNEGLTRLGQSRLWVEDNGYFAIVFELQPNSYCDAVFFNVSVCFLWEMSDGLNEAITFDYGNRLYVEGEDRIFYDENYDFYLSLYLANAIERINKYRQFRDLKYACDAYASQMRKNDFWDVYCYSILNFLYGKYDKGITYFRTFLEMLNNSIYEAGIYIEWRDRLYQCCKNERYPALANQENPRQYVIQMIRNRRKILSKRKGFDLFANELPLSEMI